MSEPIAVDNGEEKLPSEIYTWRRKCGCIKTSDKLKKILHKFPAPPPPTPLPNLPNNLQCETKCHKLGAPLPTYCLYPEAKLVSNYEVKEEKKVRSSTFWQIVTDLVELVQLSVTATALALYYIIYCYMQLVYYTLRSALYFHHADIPMKITIGVVTITSLVVGMNVLLRMERVVGLRY